VAETLDWAAALMSLGTQEVTPEVVDPTLGVLLKYQEDVKQVKGPYAERLVAEVTAAGG
jgi:hypothetical protein